MIAIKVPASSANLGPGFDVLGLALAVYNTLEIEPAAVSTLQITGEGEGTLPRGKNNLVWKTISRFYRDELGKEAPELAIKMTNNIPLSRGMGSSAATIVAAVMAANELSRRGLSKDQIFGLAAKLEGHPDNVAAAVYGGVTIAFSGDDREPAQRAVSIKPHHRLAPLLLVPAEKLSTRAARAALPDTVGYADAVFNLSRISLLIKTLIDGDLELLSAAMEDRLHQPFRTKLIPDLRKVIDLCYKAGAAGAALSGAGPSIVAFTAKQRQRDVAGAIRSALAAAGLNYKIDQYDFDLQGVAITTK